MGEHLLRVGTIFIGGSIYLPGSRDDQRDQDPCPGKASILPGCQRRKRLSLDGVAYQKDMGDLMESGKGELNVGEGSS